MGEFLKKDNILSNRILCYFNSVNQRRKDLGMSPLHIYAINLISERQMPVTQRDKMSSSSIRRWIDGKNKDDAN